MNKLTAKQEVKEKPSLMGRKSVMTNESVSKVEEAFTRGYNVLEACKYADVSTSSYYRYSEENEEFRDRIELLRSDLSIKAKNNIRLKIDDGDVDLSKWYLERRNKEEFSPRTDLLHGNNPDHPIQPLTVIYTTAKPTK